MHRILFFLSQATKVVADFVSEIHPSIDGRKREKLFWEMNFKQTTHVAKIHFAERTNVLAERTQKIWRNCLKFILSCGIVISRAGKTIWEQFFPRSNVPSRPFARLEALFEYSESRKNVFGPLSRGCIRWMLIVFRVRFCRKTPWVDRQTFVRITSKNPPYSPKSESFQQKCEKRRRRQPKEIAVRKKNLFDEMATTTFIWFD